MILRSHRSVLGVPGAVLLSLVIVGEVLAAHTWSAAIPLTGSGEGFAKGIVGLNATTAVAVYEEWNGANYDVTVRRTTTSGSTWDAPLTLSTRGYPSAIAGLDPFVDVVWVAGGTSSTTCTAVLVSCTRSDSVNEWIAALVAL